MILARNSSHSAASGSPIQVSAADRAPSKPWAEIFAELYPTDEDPIRVPEWMAINLQAFNAAFAELSQRHPGQFALVHYGKVIGVYANESAGLRDAYKQLGRSAKFLLKKLAVDAEPEQSLYHAVPECRS